MAVWGAGKGRSTGSTPDGHSEGPHPARALRLAIELEFRASLRLLGWAEGCDLERDLSLPRAFSLAGGLIPLPRL